MERFLYHSFPRRGAATADETERKGLAILRSIATSGLLLVPELLHIEVRGRPSRMPLEQLRICFTDLRPDELDEHGSKFGPFALEFDFQACVELGALPVRYVPSAEWIGNDTMAARLSTALQDLQELTGRIDFLKKGIPASAPPGASVDFFFGSTDAKVSLPVKVARQLGDALAHSLEAPRNLKEVVECMLSLSYLTGDLNYDDGLGYYRQREWRIVSEAVSDTLRRLSHSEAKSLCDMDNPFFNRQLLFRGTNATVVEHCHFLQTVKSRRVVDLVRRVVVPESGLAEARLIWPDGSKVVTGKDRAKFA